MRSVQRGLLLGNIAKHHLYFEVPSEVQFRSSLWTTFYQFVQFVKVEVRSIQACSWAYLARSDVHRSAVQLLQTPDMAIGRGNAADNTYMITFQSHVLRLSPALSHKNSQRHLGTLRRKLIFEQRKRVSKNTRLPLFPEMGVPCEGTQRRQSKTHEEAGGLEDLPAACATSRCIVPSDSTWTRVRHSCWRQWTISRVRHQKALIQDARLLFWTKTRETRSNTHKRSECTQVRCSI